MVSAMTSYSSWHHGAFLFLGNIRLKAISNSHQWPKHSWRAVFSSSLQNNVYYRWISSYFSCKQSSKHKNAKLSILAGEDLTLKNPPEWRTLTWNSTAQATKMDGDGSNKQQSTASSNKQQSTASSNKQQRTPLNEFQMLKSKWKRFWIISLINIWANIVVRKHISLADEFVWYCPRLLGFHSLNVNAMKCIYVGFSLSKLHAVILVKNIFELMFNKARRF